MADEKEHALELERIRNEHNKKVKKLVNEKVEFKRKKGFKRQNSYMGQLDEFGDIDDADALKDRFGRMRRSIDPNKKREIYNTRVEDICIHRLEKDIMAASITESMGATGFGKGARRTGGSRFARETGQTMGSIVQDGA